MGPDLPSKNSLAFLCQLVSPFFSVEMFDKCKFVLSISRMLLFILRLVDLFIFRKVHGNLNSCYFFFVLFTFELFFNGYFMSTLFAILQSHIKLVIGVCSDLMSSSMGSLYGSK